MYLLLVDDRRRKADGGCNLESSGTVVDGATLQHPHRPTDIIRNRLFAAEAQLVLAKLARQLRRLMRLSVVVASHAVGESPFAAGESAGMCLIF